MRRRKDKDRVEITLRSGAIFVVERRGLNVHFLQPGVDGGPIVVTANHRPIAMFDHFCSVSVAYA